jgi:hypothetical protein
MGDTFFHKVTYPFIDRESGGSIDGMIAAAKRGLALVKPGGKVIPDTVRSPPARNCRPITTCWWTSAQGRRGVRAGRTKAQVIASKPTAAYAGKVQEGFIKADDFSGGIYDELKAKQPRRRR